MFVARCPDDSKLVPSGASLARCWPTEDCHCGDLGCRRLSARVLGGVSYITHRRGRNSHSAGGVRSRRCAALGPYDNQTRESSIQSLEESRSPASQPHDRGGTGMESYEQEIHYLCGDHGHRLYRACFRQLPTDHKKPWACLVTGWHQDRVRIEQRWKC